MFFSFFFFSVPPFHTCTPLPFLYGFVDTTRFVALEKIQPTGAVRSCGTSPTLWRAEVKIVSDEANAESNGEPMEVSTTRVLLMAH